MRRSVWLPRATTFAALSALGPYITEFGTGHSRDARPLLPGDCTALAAALPNLTALHLGLQGGSVPGASLMALVQRLPRLQRLRLCRLPKDPADVVAAAVCAQQQGQVHGQRRDPLAGVCPSLLPLPDMNANAGVLNDSEFVLVGAGSASMARLGVVACRSLLLCSRAAASGAGKEEEGDGSWAGKELWPLCYDKLTTI